MKLLITFVVLTGFAAASALADVDMKDSHEFGVTPTHTDPCFGHVGDGDFCPQDTKKPFQQTGNFVHIGGEASMGLVYDGSKVSPKSTFSIMISFGDAAKKKGRAH